MLNLPDLEKRWLHYKVKSLLPYGIIIFSMLIITIVVFNFMDETKVLQEENTQLVDIKQVTIPTTIAKEE